jgi:hypothetical protein
MAKTSSIVFGIIFIIAGIWGFISSPILGIFAADTMSSVVHIIVGIILLAMAAKPAAVATLKTIGVIYVIFAIIGFISGSSMLGIFTVNAGANWLYLILGIVIAVLGWSGKESSSPMAPQM